MHHHLIREGTRTRVGIVLESGEPREVHHFSLLIGYGAGAINPYLAFETLDDMIRQGLLVENHATRTPARITSRPPSRAWSRSFPRWASPPFKAIAARRFLKPSACIRRSSKSISPAPLRASAASAWMSSRARCRLRHQHAFPNRQVNGHVAGCRRQLPMAGRRRVPSVQSRRPSTNCNRPAATPITRPSRSIRSRSTTSPKRPAPCAACWN